MPEPTTAATGSDFYRRLARIIDERGEDTTPGPIDDAPNPEEPGHPAYHHRQRVTAALAKLEAHAPPRYKGATTDHPAVCAWADQVAAAPEKAGSLLLWGPTGPGKTHHAYGAVRRIAEAGTARFGFAATTFPDLFAALRPGGASDDERERLMRRYLDSPLLLLDDLGTTKESAWTEEMTYRIVNHRYNQLLPTIVTTNHPPRDLPGMCGDRIASRLIGMTTRIHFDGDDRRLS